MSIATEITRLQTAKADIKTAIEAKGVTVPSSATLDTYNTYVSQISGGGGSETLLKSIIQKTATTLSASDITTAYETSDTIPDMAFGMYDNNYNSTEQTWPYNIPLTSITLPATIKNIGYGAFWGANNLTTIDLTNCSNVTFGVDAFANSAITSFTAPTGSVVKSLTFYMCPNLTTADLSNVDASTWNSTANNSGGYRMFRSCEALTEVTLPTNIAAIPKDFFSLCSSLQKVNFAGTKSEYGSLAKGTNYSQSVPSTCLVYCSDGTRSI